MPDVEGGIEIKLKTGEVIKAPSYEEAIKVAVKMAEDSKEWGHGEKAAREQLQAEVNDLRTQFQNANKPKPPTGAMSEQQNQEYYRLLNSDPVAAHNYVDAIRFGQDPVEVMNNMNKRVQEMHGINLAAQFMQQHGKEFPVQDKNAADVFTKRFRQLTAAGHPDDMDTMELAWQQIVSSGEIKPLEEKQDIPREEPNPRLEGAGGQDIPQEEISKVEQMSTADMQKYLQSKGLI